MTDEVEKKILDLYFNEMYSYTDIIAYFKNKYTYPQIKKVINKRYEKTQKTIV